MLPGSRAQVLGGTAGGAGLGGVFPRVSPMPFRRSFRLTPMISAACCGHTVSSGMQTAPFSTRGCSSSSIKSSVSRECPVQALQNSPGVMSRLSSRSCVLSTGRQQTPPGSTAARQCTGWSF